MFDNASVFLCFIQHRDRDLTPDRVRMDPHVNAADDMEEDDPLDAPTLDQCS